MHQSTWLMAVSAFLPEGSPPPGLCLHPLVLCFLWKPLSYCKAKFKIHLVMKFSPNTQFTLTFPLFWTTKVNSTFKNSVLSYGWTYPKVLRGKLASHQVPAGWVPSESPQSQTHVRSLLWPPEWRRHSWAPVCVLHPPSIEHGNGFSLLGIKSLWKDIHRSGFYQQWTVGGLDNPESIPK